MAVSAIPMEKWHSDGDLLDVDLLDGNLLDIDIGTLSS